MSISSHLTERVDHHHIQIRHYKNTETMITKYCSTLIPTVEHRKTFRFTHPF